MLHEPIEVPTLKDGYERYVNTLDDLVTQHQPQLVILGHEPTGVYHESWARNLMIRYADHLEGQANPRFLYYFVNSYQVKLNRTQTFLSFDKTDQIDLGSIGDLLARGLGSPARLPSATNLLVRQEVRSIRATQSEQRRVANRIMATFDQLIPGAFTSTGSVQASIPVALPALTPTCPLPSPWPPAPWNAR